MKKAYLVSFLSLCGALGLFLGQASASTTSTIEDRPIQSVPGFPSIFYSYRFGNTHGVNGEFVSVAIGHVVSTSTPELLCGVSVHLQRSLGVLDGDPSFVGSLWRGSPTGTLIYEADPIPVSVLAPILHDYPSDYIDSATSSLATWTFPTCIAMPIGFSMFWKIEERQVRPFVDSDAYLMVGQTGDSDSNFFYVLSSGGGWTLDTGSEGAIRWFGQGGDDLSSGFPEPIISSYGFSTSSALGTDFGYFGNLLRDLFLWLFAPNQSAMNSLQSLKANAMTRVPWGWWTQISTGFGSVSSTQAATTTVLSMEVPHGNTTTTVTIFDIHSVLALIPSSLLFLIRTIGGVAIWALFGTWIWNLVTGSQGSDDES
jgi:hypothetical protein